MSWEITYLEGGSGRRCSILLSHGTAEEAFTGLRIIEETLGHGDPTLLNIRSSDRETYDDPRE